jgi:glyoxylase-like metal-dependent hydrolase (beta-lactamase superfamily II)
VAPFFKNGYLVSCETTREAVLIDPGDEVESLIEAARENRLDVRAILLTHAHLDHITGVGRAKAALNVPVWLDRADLFLYEGVVEQGRMFDSDVDPQPPVDAFYDQRRPSGSAIRRRHPADAGPLSGRRVLAIGAALARARAFVGDTLFAGSIGRTDLPGGDYETLIDRFAPCCLRFRTRRSSTPATVRTPRSARSAGRIRS